MKRERNTCQMKDKDRHPGEKKNLNEMEAGKLPDSEFKTIVVIMLQELKVKIDKIRTSTKGL